MLHPGADTPLAKWGDTASYWLAPGGTFEGAMTGWTLKNALNVLVEHGLQRRELLGESSDEAHVAQSRGRRFPARETGPAVSIW